ncbi:NAD(+) diphosphatase [Arsenicicoccus sp. oral taxon 190]|uniref:NAD(+) diphosphatase n=1 Tax=Arsenicicoccus sp. oral taxon 190 TaxID=1658671 RepID=UPI000679F8F6|nr:NAD(+) diphosphatase [Arsenicicoccus sp. oral taxon 190]AKT51397.1 hypothetical protein ADJ73_08820 [Arsenicicoccus sp. oral taxon 190]
MTGAPRNLPQLALSRTGLDRAGWRRKEPGLLDQLLADPATAVVELRGERLETYADGTALVRRRPSEAPLRPGDVALYLGQDPRGVEVVGLVRDAVEDDPAPGWSGLRVLGLSLDAVDVHIAASLVGMGHWHRSHRHCARCGQPTTPVEAGWVRACPLGHHSFPVTSPAVIMAVTDPHDRLLLARNTAWPQGRWSVLAGFVEPGESLEAAVAREVAEEVGVLVEDVRYAGNQPWPFPASLMLAFTARAARGTALRFADAEIAEARWYSREELRAAVGSGAILSGGTPVSVAYHLIESWLGEPIAGLQPARG